MADTVKILSWNIQKFGAKKLNDPDFIKYVCHVIYQSGADVVGIMEIVGWVGQDVKNKLVATLNSTGVSWQGAESEMTPSRPHEQYVLLWKTNKVTACVFGTYGIVGDEVFETFFKSNTARWTATQIALFWQLLLNKGYLDDNYMVTDNARASLGRDYRNLDLTDPSVGITLSNSEKQAIVRILLADDALAFPYPGSRPPFCARISLAATQGPDVPMFLALYHAPGPTGTWPAIASNQLGLIPDVRTSPRTVVMGDFNVKRAQLTQLVQLFKSDEKGNLENVYDGNQKLTARPFQRLTGPQITVSAIKPDNQCFSYTARLPNPNTSLVATVQSPNVLATDTVVQGLQLEPYDNFYTFGFTAVVSASVVPLIALMIPKYTPITNKPNDPSNTVRSTTTAPYDGQGAQFAALLWNAWWDGQTAKGVRRSGITQTFGKFNPNDVPASLRSAHVVYRNAISDHLPVFAELQYA